MVITYLFLSSSQDRKRAKKGAAAAQLETFSLLLADIVRIPDSGAAQLDEKLVTKYDYQLAKVMWEIGDEEGEEDDEEEENDGNDDQVGGRSTSARAGANILSSRLRERRKEGDDGLTQGEIDKQMNALVKKKMKERADKAEKSGKKDDNGDDGEVEELQAYR